MPGRKSVIPFSQVFDMWGIGPWARDQLRLPVERLNRAAVSVCTIDARGLVVPMISAEEGMTARSFKERDDVAGGRSSQVFFEQGGLEYNSHETGGLTFFNRNKLSDGVRQALGDQNGYYLLGCVPQESSFKRDTKKLPPFRKLTVKVKRAGLRERSRSGYLGAQAGWNVIILTGSLTLTQAVKPGQYAIEVVIDDELAAFDKRTARQLMDFEVVN